MSGYGRSRQLVNAPPVTAPCGLIEDSLPYCIVLVFWQRPLTCTYAHIVISFTSSLPIQRTKPLAKIFTRPLQFLESLFSEFTTNADTKRVSPGQHWTKGNRATYSIRSCVTQSSPFNIYSAGSALRRYLIHSMAVP